MTIDQDLITAADQPSAPAGNFAAADLTDLAFARRIVKMFGRDLRYVHAWNTWLVWDGRRWCVDATDRASRLAKKVADSMWPDAPKRGGEDAVAGWARYCMKASSHKVIMAALSLAKSEPGIPVLPHELDANPWLLNAKNGAVDLRTGKVHPHQREHLCTKLAGVSYDPEALGKLDYLASAAPTFARFLETSVGEPEKVAYLQRCVGYSLTGSTEEEVLLYLAGPGRNGKSKFLEAFLAIAGDYGAAMPHDLLAVRGESHPQRLAAFHGVRFATCVEVASGMLDVELLKLLTGGDTLTARRMRENQWSFAPTHTLWMTANNDPKVSDRTISIWQRLKKVPFDRTFVGADRDNRLAEKLRREYPAMLAWAVQGCLDWQSMQGLAEPEVVKAATAGYRDSQDWVADFLSDRCVESEQAVAYSGDVYKAYTGWVSENGLRHPVSQKALTMELKTRFGYEEKHGPARKGAFIGLGLQTEHGRWAGPIDPPVDDEMF